MSSGPDGAGHKGSQALQVHSEIAGLSHSKAGGGDQQLERPDRGIAAAAHDCCRPHCRPHPQVFRYHTAGLARLSPEKRWRLSHQLYLCTMAFAQRIAWMQHRMFAAAAISDISKLGDAMNAQPMLCIQHKGHVLKGHYLHLHMHSLQPSCTCTSCIATATT